MKLLRFGSGAMLLIALIATLWSCRRPGTSPPSPEEVVLRRRVQELENLAEFARHSPLVPFDQALITIDQRTLQALLTAALPYENVVDEKFRIRVIAGTVTCDDGLALVRLDGRASFADRPEQDAYVEATVWGVLEEFDLDPEESALHGRVNTIAFETRRAQFLGEDHRAVRGLLHDLARLRIEAFARTDYGFDMPVRLVRELVLPDIRSDGGVSIGAARVPLAVSVVDVKAFRQKLWISFRLYDESGSDSGRVAAASPEGQAR